LFAVFDAALRLLHPFMPFITEELWWQLPQTEGDKSIAMKSYPGESAKKGTPPRVNEFALAQEVITEVRNIRAEMKLDPRKKVAAEFYTSQEHLRSAIQKNIDGIQRLAILSDFKVSENALTQSAGAMRSTARFDIRIAYSDTVDIAAESERLRKEIERLQKDIASKERQLGDETFRSRAPEKIIKGMLATLEERRIELGKSSERLRQLESGA
jgi:valyl-tRNA synthetase